MKVTVSIRDVIDVEADGVIVNLFEGSDEPSGATAVVDKALDGTITSLINLGEIKGKYNEVSIVHSFGKLKARIVAVAGLGKQADFNLEKVRNIMGQVCRTLHKHNCQRIATIVHGAGVGGMDLEKAAQAVVEGSILGLYDFRKHITREPDYKPVEELIIVHRDSEQKEKLERACRFGQILAEATNHARDMVNEPANYMTPSDMVKIAMELAKQYQLDLTVLEKEDMQKEGMGALLGVAQGSAQPPKMIILSYRGDKDSDSTIGFIGKGITFDSGGISLKPAENMKDMKGDMSGGAAVLSAVAAIAKSKLKINVTAIVAATENLPGGRALKPGDIVKAINGKTIEVVNTDAEGRLTLADALGYAVKKGISPLVDVATLTGACKVALGDVCSGIFTNNEEFMRKVIKAGDDAGECLWQLPMKEDYRELNKSDVADVKNSGGGYAGAITAAMFLSEFVGDKPWVHIDIAGTAMSEKEKGYLVKGATGVSVRTLVNLAKALSK